MGLKRGIPEPALVVPDEESCLVFGASDGDWVAVEDPGRARALVLPARIPDELVTAVRTAWSLMPSDRALHTYRLPVGGPPARDVLAGAGEDDRDDHDPHGDHEGHGDDEGHGDEGHGEHNGHGEHDHGDMMAITGEPSADGLVMEAMDVQAGPLGVALPGGLVVRASLDGDVVAECQVTSTLRAADVASPDPWSAMAWAAAELAATERAAGVAPHAGRWFRLAAVEVERAVSHLAWLHRFVRLLGWEQMRTRTRGILAAAVAVRSALPVELTTPDLPDVSTVSLRAELTRVAEASDKLAAGVEDSRAFGRRTTGLGRIPADDAAGRRLTGPVARASGITEDTRAGDAGYAALRFEPVVHEAGDARARTLLRAQEAAQSLRLAAAAVERASASGTDDAMPQFGRSPAGLVESARGPVRVLVSDDGTVQRTTPGARAAAQAAGELAGREWAAALVTVASFDLSAWRVGP